MLRSNRNRGRRGVSNWCCWGHEPLNAKSNRRLLSRVLRSREKRAWRRDQEV